MLSRFTMYATAALLLVASFATAQPALRVRTVAIRTVPMRTPLVVKTYQVADLVAPVPDDIDVRGKSKTSWAVEQNDSEEVETRRQSAKMMVRVDQLMHIINTHIEPTSWKAVGGIGQMNYHPLTMSLVVNQTPEVHERIEMFLTQMRKLRAKQDCQVVLEIRLLSVADGFTKTVLDQIQDLDRNKCEHGVCEHDVCEQAVCKDDECKRNASCFTLSDREMFLLLTSAQEDERTNILMAPKLCTLNNRNATIRVDGVQISVRPKISADRRYINMTTDCAIEHKTCEGDKKELRRKVETVVPDGKTLVIRGFGPIAREVRQCCGDVPILSQIPYIKEKMKNVGYGKEQFECILLVTPRIVVLEEEELRVLHPTPKMNRPQVQVAVPAPRALPLPNQPYRVNVAVRPQLEPAPPLPKDYFQRMQASTAAKVREYLDAYYRACAEGDEEAALKYGKKALRLDPTVFGRQR